MDPTLTWLLLIVAAALILFGALRLDLLALHWRQRTGRPPVAHDAPPAPRWTARSGFQPHAAPIHKPAFHRSGRRH